MQAKGIIYIENQTVQEAGADKLPKIGARE